MDPWQEKAAFDCIEVRYEGADANRLCEYCLLEMGRITPAPSGACVDCRVVRTAFGLVLAVVGWWLIGIPMLGIDVNFKIQTAWEREGA